MPLRPSDWNVYSCVFLERFVWVGGILCFKYIFVNCVALFNLVNVYLL